MLYSDCLAKEIYYNLEEIKFIYFIINSSIQRYKDDKKTKVNKQILLINSVIYLSINRKSSVKKNPNLFIILNLMY